MHRHGYKGRKLGRKRDQRRALLKGLSTSLILDESIETTLPKAKEVLPFTEKLITKAKVGDLHNRRQVISALGSVEATNKLFETVVPSTTGRDSGYLRLKKTALRRGDGTQMAQVSFVDEIKEAKKETPKKKVTAKKKPAKTKEKVAKA